jgi:hypothetical protein
MTCHCGFINLKPGHVALCFKCIKPLIETLENVLFHVIWIQTYIYCASRVAPKKLQSIIKDSSAFILHLTHQLLGFGANNKEIINYATSNYPRSIYW